MKVNAFRENVMEYTPIAASVENATRTVELITKVIFSLIYLTVYNC